ncbi:uncharacterized protein LOC143619244 [Bidens hawaiensis]|uniref:uncharacterized protein LOC143619244 n=1 Tax=Bidens hawaiensis TaxID=980011 RepID=UPI00404B295A
MPVSESEKLGVFVLGCHFSEKAEHIPIKKRRFLFNTSSPPRNTTNPSLEGAEGHGTSPKLNSNLSFLPATHEAVTGICERGSKDYKLDKKELVKDDDFSGISILAAAACSNSLVAETDRTSEVPKTVEFNEKNVKNEPVFHTITVTSEVDESTLTKEPNIQKSPARDVRFSWDLNTVMDTWEEPSVSGHEISNDKAIYVEKKKVNSVSQPLPVELNSLAHEKKELKVEKCELLSHESGSFQHAVVVKTESLHYNQTNYASYSIPVTRTLLENQTQHGSFSKFVGGTQAVDTKFSIDCSIPPGFDHCLNLHASKENAGPTTQTAVTKHDLSLKTETHVENEQKVEDDLVNKEEIDKIGSKVVMEDQSAATSSIHDVSHSDIDNGFDYYNLQCGNKAESGIGCDSQYEDGEVREWTVNAWKGYELTGYENQYGMNNENSLDLDNVDAHATNIHSGPSVVLPDPELNELTSGPYKSERQYNMEGRSSQSDEWKTNISGWDVLPESQRINSNNLNKTRNFTGRKFSYREEQKDKFGTEYVEMKAEGTRFYRKGSPTRDVFLSRGRFQIQRHSSKEGDSLTYRPEREFGAPRSFRRGRYSPHNGPSDREGGMWNRSILEDSSAMDNLKNDGDNNIPSFVARRPLRGRSPSDREVIEFRARLGLRPTEDTGRDRFVKRGRGRGQGRFMSYDTRGPARDECDEPLTEYSHFPRRLRCFSPIERRGNNSYQYHRSNSRSPSGFRCRSRSPGFRIRRPRSPGYRDHLSEYHYKERPFFNRSTPPRRTGGPQGERFNFYEGERGGPMYVDDDGVRLNNNGSRGGGFVRRYKVDGPAKRFHYDDEGGCSRGIGFDARDRRALEVHARSSLKPGSDGSDSRFRDFPRRQREDGGEFRRRSRDGKERKEEGEEMVDGTERRPREVKDQSITANHDLMVANEVVKESGT